MLLVLQLCVAGRPEALCAVKRINIKTGAPLGHPENFVLLSLTLKINRGLTWLFLVLCLAPLDEKPPPTLEFCQTPDLDYSCGF